MVFILPAIMIVLGLAFLGLGQRSQTGKNQRAWSALGTSCVILAFIALIAGAIMSSW